MKFYLLPVGDTFSFQGKQYTKSGPLTASSADTGSNKMIPRSANIQVSRELEIKEATKKENDHLLSIDVAKAINCYQDVINECLMDIKNEVDDDLFKKTQSKLGNIYRKTLKKLSLN